MPLNTTPKTVDDIITQVAEDLKDKEKITFQELQNVCDALIKGIKILQDTNKHIISQITTKKDKPIARQIDILYQFMHMSEGNVREVLKLQHMFQAALDKFLDRTIYMIWVDEEGKTFLYDSEQIGRIYGLATKNVGRGNISQTSMKNFNNLPKQVTNTEQVTDTEQVTNTVIEQIRAQIEDAQGKRQNVYRLAIRRFDASTKLKSSKFHNSVYWKTNPEDRYRYLITGHKSARNKGDVAEGYVRGIINDTNPKTEYPKTVAKEGKYYPLTVECAIQHLCTYIEVNSIPAIEQGDVVRVTVDDNSGKIQFAVKQGSYSTAKFGQYLRAAYGILALKKALTAENLEKELKNLAKYEKVDAKTNEIANKQVKKVVDSTLTVKSK